MSWPLMSFETDGTSLLRYLPQGTKLSKYQTNLPALQRMYKFSTINILNELSKIMWGQTLSFSLLDGKSRQGLT